MEIYEIAARWLTFEEFMKFTPAAFNVYATIRAKAERDQYYIDNKRFGVVCATIANSNSKKRYKASDFFNTEPRDQQTPEQMAEIFKAITIGLGGTVIE
jgi:hypothetical protein